MKYKKFIIKNYRGINGPLSIDIKRDHLIPIIGVNESGKTTILHAILAFDYINDKQNSELHIADNKFFLLPKFGNRRKTTLENLFDPVDMKLLRNALSLPNNCSFDKVIAALYYSQHRKQSIESFTGQTLNRFKIVFDSLKLN